jgi:hypothetical protein
MSSPEVQHSRNITARPEVSLVVFDSRAPIGEGGETAVYVAATARQVPADEVDQWLPLYAASTDMHTLSAEDVSPPARYRLWVATASEWSMLCPRATGVPCDEHGLAVDHRTQVHPI